MRTRLGVAAALVALAGCQCGEVPTDGAAKLVLSYSGFHPGCLQLSVWDAAAPSTRKTDQTLTVPAGSRSDTLVIAVYRGKGWSHNLGIQAVARERSCAGPEVARESAQVTIESGRPPADASLSLVASDADGDDYVDEANGGTDCDDHSAAVHPGAVELCNDVDDDCANGIDDGFDAGQVCPPGFCGVWACAPDGGQLCSTASVPWYPDLDHDGHGRDAGSVLACENPDGGYSADDLDCNDALANVYPGAPELCDALDNNCDGTVDDGFDAGDPCTSGGCLGIRACDGLGGVYCEVPPPTWYYPDFDRDTYGASDAGRIIATCNGYGPDAGMSNVATDCNDQVASIHPGAVEICDGIDNNCSGVIDEPFDAGWTCGGAGACSGTIVCLPDGGAMCNAPAPVTYFIDDDMDDDGRPDSGTGWCSPPDGGKWVDAGTDCDDGDPFTRPGKREICDGRDNNCNGQVDEGGGTCPPSPGWTAHNTPGAGNDDWETVAVYSDGGTGVWIASGPQTANNVTTKRPGANPGTWLAKTDCSGQWYGSWADPRTGRVYLVGSSNKASYYDVEATSCVSTTAASSVQDPRGVVGYGESPDALMYTVALDAKSALWDGGQSWSPFPTPGSTSFDDVHGISPDVMFAVGGDATGTGARPRIYRFDPADAGWYRDQALPGGLPQAKLHSVWVVNPKLAYAVGSDPGRADNFLVWDGSRWQNHLIPAGVNSLTGVLAFGRSRVWVIDDNGASSGIYEYELDGGWSKVDSVGKSLRGIAGTSPEDIWVVGWDGTVIHWPE